MPKKKCVVKDPFGDDDGAESKWSDNISPSLVRLKELKETDLS